MKDKKKHIEKLRKGILQAAKEKAEIISFFEKGGEVKDYKSKDSRIVRPI